MQFHSLEVERPSIPSKAANLFDLLGMRQTSVRSIAVGLLVGSLMCTTNMYFGLQTGWITMGSLQSAILGYGIFKLLKQLGLVSGFSIAENVIVQTTSVATATMPLAAGFVGVIPALAQLTPEENPPKGPYDFSNMQLVVWSMALAFFGVFVAIPLRTQVIEREQLKFPSGTATAQVIKTMHAVPMDEPADPDPRRVVPRLRIIPDRVPSARNEVPGGFRFCSTASLVDWQHSRKSSDIVLSTNLSVALGDSVLAQAYVPSTQQQSHTPGTGRGVGPGAPSGGAHGLIGTSLAIGREDGESPVKGDVAGYNVSSIEQTWVALGGSFLLSFIVTAFASILEIVNKIHAWSIPTTVPLFGSAACTYGWKLGANVGYVGQGMIMGPRVCFSMLAGAIVGFGVLAPMAVRRGWASSDAHSTDGCVAWVSWVAMCIMIADSLTSLTVLVLRYSYQLLSQQRRRGGYSSVGWPELPVAESFDNQTAFLGASEAQALTSSRVTGGDQQRTEPVLNPDEGESEICEKFPTWVWVSGIVVSIAAATGVFGAMFPMPHWQVTTAMFLAMLVAVLAVRALGETDLNPVSGIGKLTQVVFALLSPGQVLPNLVAGAISEAAAAQAGEMMQDFKTAYLLGICPKAQFVAAAIGSLASCGISTAAYALFSSVYEIGGPQLPAPTAAIWLDMARLVTGGELPPHVVTYCWAGAIFGCLFALLPDILTAIQVTRWFKSLQPGDIIRSTVLGVESVMPSGIGFAIGMYILPQFVLPRVIGGLLGAEIMWSRIALPAQKGNMLVTASGLVLGEGIASMTFTAVKAVLG